MAENALLNNKVGDLRKQMQLHCVAKCLPVIARYLVCTLCLLNIDKQPT